MEGMNCDYPRALPCHLPLPPASEGSKLDKQKPCTTLQKPQSSHNDLPSFVSASTPLPSNPATMATQSDTPIPVSSTNATQTTHSKAAIIGGAIGGTLFLLLLLVAMFIPLFRQRRSCLDIALRRQSKATTTTTSIRKDSMLDEKIVQHQNAEVDVEKEQREEEGNGGKDEEEMLGLEEMLRITFPSPSRYELDAGGVVEGRANWEIKL